jgi:hypothetical protein
MHATPGEIKSFRSSAERMALMLRRVVVGEGWQAVLRCDQEKTVKTANTFTMQVEMRRVNEERIQSTMQLRKSKSFAPMSRRKQSQRAGLSIGLHFQKIPMTQLRRTPRQVATLVLGIHTFCMSTFVASHVLAHGNIKCNRSIYPHLATLVAVIWSVTEHRSIQHAGCMLFGRSI